MSASACTPDACAFGYRPEVCATMPGICGECGDNHIDPRRDGVRCNHCWLMLVFHRDLCGCNGFKANSEGAKLFGRGCACGPLFRAAQRKERTA